MSNVNVRRKPTVEDLVKKIEQLNNNPDNFSFGWRFELDSMSSTGWRADMSISFEVSPEVVQKDL